MKHLKLYEEFKGIPKSIQEEYDDLILQSMDGSAHPDIGEIEDRIDELRKIFPDIKYTRTNEEFNQDQLEKQDDHAVGDQVYINYKVPGGNNDYVPTPVKIISIKGSGNQKVYIGSHNVELSEFKNAPNQMVKKSDIIGPYKGIDTPVGPGWVSSNPSINTGVNQVSNDMAL